MPNKVHAVISAEISDAQVDPVLLDVLIKHMTHRPAGSINKNSPCLMVINIQNDIHGHFYRDNYW